MANDPLSIIANYKIPPRPEIPECTFCNENGFPGIVHEDGLPDFRHLTPPPGTGLEKLLHDNEHTDIGIYAGYSAGKTTAAASIALRNTMELPGWRVLWLVPDFSVHEDTTLPVLLELLPEQIRPESLSSLRRKDTRFLSLHFSPNEGRAYLTFKMLDSMIMLRTYNQSQVGFQVHEAIFDEVEADPNLKIKVIEEARWRVRQKIKGLEAKQSFARNRHFYFTTPNTGILQDYLRDLPNSVMYEMSAFENPWNNEEKILQEMERAKHDPLAFSLVTGHFIPHRGHILTTFDKELNVRREVDMPRLSEYDGFVGGIDWATGGSSVMAPVGIIRDNGVDRYFVLDEFYQRGAEWPTMAHQAFIQFRDQIPGLSKWWMDYHGQRREPQDEYSIRHQELRDMGWDVDGRMNDTWMSAGDGEDALRYRIGKLLELLKPDETGQPKLVLSERCVNIIRDIENWKWMEDKGSGWNTDLWKPSRHYKDGIDAIWYAIIGWERRSATAYDYVNRPRSKKLNRPRYVRYRR